MRILITGITGFIGSSFAHCVERAGHTVMGTGRKQSAGPELPWLYAKTDGTSESLSEIIGNFGPDVLLAAAGTASVGESLANPLNDFVGSVQASVNVLEAARQSGCNPLIIIPSSAAVYGNPVRLPVDEEASLQPISPYGFHKAASELLAREYAECFGLDVIVCRLFSVFGFAQRRLLVWELYKQLAGPEPSAWVEGTGSESRDFLHIDDVSAALLGLIEHRRQNAVHSFLIANVGSGIETSVASLAEQMRDLIAPEKEVRYRGNVRKNDPLRWRADISRLQAILPAWQPRPLMQALELCVNSWKQKDPVSQHGF